MTDVKPIIREIRFSGPGVPRVTQKGGGAIFKMRPGPDNKVTFIGQLPRGYRVDREKLAKSNSGGTSLSVSQLFRSVTAEFTGHVVDETMAQARATDSLEVIGRLTELYIALFEGLPIR